MTKPLHPVFLIRVASASQLTSRWSRPSRDCLLEFEVICGGSTWSLHFFSFSLPCIERQVKLDRPLLPPNNRSQCLSTPVQLSNSNPKVNAMQAKLQEQLSPADAKVILRHLPERIQAASIARAAEIEYPIEAAIAISIANFLDTEALGFVDCKPGRGQ